MQNNTATRIAQLAEDLQGHGDPLVQRVAGELAEIVAELADQADQLVAQLADQAERAERARATWAQATWAQAQIGAWAELADQAWARRQCPGLGIENFMALCRKRSAPADETEEEDHL